MKKTFNWLGWLIIILYLTIDATFCYLTVFYYSQLMVSQREEQFIACVVSASIAFLMIPVGAAMLPIWYDWALGKILPCQKAFAIVILPEISVSHVYRKGVTRTNVRHFVTFELTGGERLVFKVSENIYYTLLRGERGTLTYKAQGKHTYFVNFKRQY